MRKARIFAVNGPGENHGAINHLNKHIDGVHMLKTFADGACLVDHVLNYQQPDLIILDHRPPQLDAISIVKTLKTTSQLKLIPIIVWGCPATREDLQAIYLAGANCCIEVPDDNDELALTIELFFHYWLEVVLLPKQSIFDTFL